MWTGPLSEIASGIEVTILAALYARVFKNQHRSSPSGAGGARRVDDERVTSAEGGNPTTNNKFVAAGTMSMRGKRALSRMNSAPMAQEPTPRQTNHRRIEMGPWSSLRPEITREVADVWFITGHESAAHHDPHHDHQPNQDGAVARARVTSNGDEVWRRPSGERVSTSGKSAADSTHEQQQQTSSRIRDRRLSHRLTPVDMA